MSRLAEIQQLMEQLGPATPEVSHVTQVADDAWVVGFDTESNILLELDPTGAKLAISADLGQPSADSRAALYEMFLGYNAILRETGGVRVAAVDGEAMQIATVDAAGLDPANLRALLANFADKARVWRELIERGGQARSGERAPMGVRA